MKLKFSGHHLYSGISSDQLYLSHFRNSLCSSDSMLPLTGNYLKSLRINIVYIAPGLIPTYAQARKAIFEKALRAFLYFFVQSQAETS